MASITKRKSKYSVVYDYYDDEGVRHQKWETWGTYAEAKKRKAEIEHKQTNNTFVKPSIKTVSELMYDFMNLYGVNAWALSTYDGKKGLIDNYINPIIGKVKIKDITPRFMDEYYRKLLKVQRVTHKPPLLPLFCYSLMPSSGELIRIERGCKGYEQVPYGSTGDPAVNRKTADSRNREMGVTRAQEKAMLAGSLFGWHTKAADPRSYDENGQPKRVKKRDELER